ncbi:MAG TPA: flagellar biosynthesis protein FliW [Gallionellaceae bacterium]|nr:flagellar biosynthesis protein FliW [Gallionellaceae bacterium]
MIKLKLPRLGDTSVEFEADSVINFPDGLPGFETCHRFKLFHEEGKPSINWLQSLDNPDVMFSLRDPALLNISYDVSLSDADEKLLESAPGDELLMALIVYKDGKAENKTAAVQAHMLAPIILNVSKRRGMQKILKNIDAQVVFSGT